MGKNWDLPLILRALAFAAQKHRDQRRKDVVCSPYINHPISLADILCNEAGVEDPEVLCAAVLHDTIEDTETTEGELEAAFGPAICRIVMEVTDDERLPKDERKRLQIEHAEGLSDKAKLVKLADKITNLRVMAHSPPPDWGLERRREYFDWGKKVIDKIRGIHPKLEALFDEAYSKRP
jgi:guanosine-3',5'-bis(diphosphate) 3'-pyrophosphohydrolase